MTDGDYVTGHIVFDENRNPLKQTVMISLVKGDDGKLATRYAATVNID
jgi:branched-chain amino acid transport system substrate-binding protein